MRDETVVTGGLSYRWNLIKISFKPSHSQPSTGDYDHSRGPIGERQAQFTWTNERRDSGDWGPLTQVDLDKDLSRVFALITSL